MTLRKNLEAVISPVRTILMLVFSGLVFFAATWHGLGRPNSVSEYRFLARLSEQKVGERLDLGALMPGDWEMACDAHGYAGDFYLEKYGRKYPAVGEPDDGAWGLVFIDADGSFTSASGTCKSTGVLLSTEGCATRGRAVLTREARNFPCPVFKN